MTPDPGPYRSKRTPYVREPLRNFSNRKVQRMTFCWAPQVGKSLLMQCMLGYAIDHDPGPALIVMPNEKNAKSYSKSRLQPLINDCPALAKHKPTSKSDFSLLEMHFDNMTLNLEGSNSPANLASRPIRYLFLDETDKYAAETEKEASAVDLADARTTQYRYTRKVIKTSTPTTVEGEIWQAFLAGDQRYYFVPCPHKDCQWPQRLDFKKGVKWDHQLCRKEDGSWNVRLVAKTAYYECEKCGGRITDGDKQWMLERGEWRATNPDAEEGHHSYHLNALYSLKVTFGDFAAAFVKAEAFPDALHDVINKYFAEPWKQVAEEKTTTQILKQCDEFERGYCPVVPIRVILTADVQKDKIWFAVRAWCRWETSYLLDYGHVPRANETDLDALQEVMQSVYEGPGGIELRITNTFVDSGAYTTDVYRWCRENRAIPTKGEDTGQPYRYTQLKDGQTLVVVNVEHYKTTLSGRMTVELGKPGAWHLFKGTGEDYARQIAAERYVRRKDKRGRVIFRWELPPGKPDNHLWDCEVLQMAVAQVLRVRTATTPIDLTPAAPVPKPAERDAGERFVRKPNRTEGERFVRKRR